MIFSGFSWIRVSHARMGMDDILLRPLLISNEIIQFYLFEKQNVLNKTQQQAGLPSSSNTGTTPTIVNYVTNATQHQPNLSQETNISNTCSKLFLF